MTRTDADERALEIMTGRERLEASKEGLRPSKYLCRKYGINARNHDDLNDLREAVVEASHSDD